MELNIGSKKPQFALQKGVDTFNLKEGVSVVGRKNMTSEQQTVDVALEDNSVSRQHVRLEVSDNSVYVVPFENSTNSTKINNRRLMPKERYHLKVGDELILGKDGPYKLIDLNGIVQPQPVSPKPSQHQRIETTAGQSRPERERTAKRNIDEKISLTNPDAKYFFDQKLKERMAQDSVLARHAEKLKEGDIKKAKLEELHRKQTLLHEKVKALKAKSEEMAAELSTAQDQKKQFEVDIDQGKEGSSRIDSYQKALQGFATEIQRKINAMQASLSEKNQVMKELNKKEFIRQYEKESKGTEDFRNKLLQLQSQVEIQREKLREKRSNTRDMDTHKSDHFSTIVETQYEELSLAKKQLVEYESREAASQQRWNNMLAENMGKDEKIRGLKLQIERNLDNIQLLLMDHDTRVFELSKKVFEVIAICGSEEQKEAALFLTEQLPLVQEERRELVLENEQFHLSNQETINDIEMIKADLDRFKGIIDQNIDLDRCTQTQVLAHFKAKLDKVLDRVEKQKAEERVTALSEVRSALEGLELDTAKELARKEVLQNKLSELIKQRPFTDKQSIIQFFSSLIQHRDEHIIKVQKASESLRQRKKHQYQELAQLREGVTKMDAQYEDLKVKQKNFSTAVIESEHDGYLGRSDA